MVDTQIREIEVKDYIKDFRDEPRIVGFCKQCRNYGRLWTCPPFQFDSEELLRKWKYALIVACRFELPESGDALAEMRKVRAQLESRLLEMEKEHGGLAFGFSGECLHCADCTRRQRLSCRHPKLVRPALEAYGFDIIATVSRLFGFELEWAPKGKMPQHITLVGALFHNSDAGKIFF